MDEYERFRTQQIKIYEDRVENGDIIGDGQVNLDNSIRLESSLPMPWVHYPPFGGAFPAFGNSVNGPWFLCDCQQFTLTRIVQRGGRASRLVAESANLHASIEPSRLNWAEGICHSCCGKLPTIGTFPHPPGSAGVAPLGMKGYAFETPPRWGMYIQTDFYKLGIKPENRWQLTDETHAYFHVNMGWEFKKDDLDPLIQHHVDQINEADAKYFTYFDNFHFLQDANASPEVVRRVRRDKSQSRLQLWRFVENRVRTHFGIHPIGATGKQETVLFNIVTGILTSNVVERNVQPSWLDGLELDIWIPACRIGIEYQGEQHFQSIGHWGGDKKLIEQQARDDRKRQICAKEGITLIEFFYFETLNESLVRARLAEVRPDVMEGNLRPS